MHVRTIGGALASCSECGRVCPLPAPLQCPVCKCVGTIRTSDASGREIWNPKALSQIKMDRAKRVPSGIDALDRMLDGGFVRSCSYIVDADPGAGKSTLFLQIARAFEWCLYLTGEETEGAIKARAVRLGLGPAELPGLRIHEVRDMEVFAKHATDEYECVILDSIQAFTTKDSSGTAGDTHQVKCVVKLFSDIVRKMGIVGIAASQVNKDGVAQGARANEHNVDGTIHIEMVDEHTRSFRMKKHRHGPIYHRALAKMTGRGLTDFVFVEGEGGEHGEA